MWRVAVFDDNRDRREGLSMLIDTAPNMQCVGAFTDCRNVLRHVAETTPDVVLMDIDMPHVNGIRGVELIKTHFPNVRVLMQTVFEDDDKVFASILAGADGYLLKQSMPQQVLAGIAEVMGGGAPMTPTIARKVLSFFNKRGRAAGQPSDFDLSEREIEILRLLVDGLTYRKIAERCAISYATVNSHVTRIYSKLHVRSAAGAVSIALREGLV